MDSKCVIRRVVRSGTILVLIVLLFATRMTGRQAGATPYQIKSATCTAENATRCDECIATVLQSIGGTWRCYLFTCAYSANRYSTCVQTTTTTSCCELTGGLADQPCSNCKYWWCQDVELGFLCLVGTGSTQGCNDDTCFGDDGTTYEYPWKPPLCRACPVPGGG
jgi:hypothetical protein